MLRRVLLIFTVGLFTVALSSCGGSLGNPNGQVNFGHGSVTSVSVTPGSISCPVGTTVQLTVTVTFSDGLKQDMTSQAVMTSSDASVATFLKTPGLLKCLTIGKATIMASFGGVGVSAPVDSSPAIAVSVSVNPSSFSCTAGANVQLQAMGAFSDGSEQPIPNAGWASSDGSIASVANGKVSCNSPGKVTIQASSGGLSGSSDGSVTSAAVVSISVQPTSMKLIVGSTQPLAVIATLSDGHTADLTLEARLSSSDVSIATLINSSLLRCSAVGTATVVANLGSLTGSATASCSGATVVALSVAPANVACSAGEKIQLTASALLSDGTSRDVTRDADWKSSDPLAAIVNNDWLTAGQVTCLAPGNALIDAVFGAGGSAAVAVN